MAWLENLLRSLHESAEAERRQDRRIAARAVDLASRARRAEAHALDESVLFGVESDADEQVGQAALATRELDRLANYLRSDYASRLKRICVTALALLVSFELFAHFPGFSGTWWVLALGLAAFAFGAYELFWGRARDVQIGYVTARTASELARISALWRWAGLDARVVDCIDRRHQDRLRLVVDILRRIESEPNRPPGPGAARAAVLAAWHRHQLLYFAKAYAQNRATGELWKAVSNTCFLAGVFGLLALLVLTAFGVHVHDDALCHMLLTFAPAGIVCAAIAEFYAERRAFEANAERYAYAHNIFGVGHEGYEDWPETHGFDVAAVARAALFVLFGFCLGWIVMTRLSGAEDLRHFATAAAVGIVALLSSIGVNFWHRDSEVRRMGGEVTEAAEGKSGPEFVAAWMHALGPLESSLTNDEWRAHLLDVGEEAAHEVIDWHISTVDREITMPKG